MHTIKPSFKIPAKYRRMFILMMGDFKYCIVADRNGIHSGQQGILPSVSSDRHVLDFIKDSMHQIRRDCA